MLVPHWREHAVIRQMLERNLSVIRYRSYDLFVGVYPNDPQTIDAVNAAARVDACIHLAMCPHGGPTSKGDYLNWIYRATAAYEVAQQTRFDIVVTHDAEDLIQRDGLRLINWLSHITT